MDWLVLTELTEHSGTQVGIVTALQFLPVLLFTAWAGVLADRLDRRRLVQSCQAVVALVALIVGALVVSGYAQLWQIYVLAFVSGVASAIEMPARQAFVSELVPQESVPNAVALNSTAFNTARLIGPAMAGFVIQWVGTGWVFLANALLLMAPIAALAFIRTEELLVRKRLPRAKGQFREGVRYVRHRPDIVLVLVVVTVIGGLGLNFQLTSAMMATEVFGKEAGEYGMLSSVLAIGSLSGSLVAARRQRPRLRTIIGAAGAFGLAELALGLAPSYWIFAACAIPTGFATITMLNSANTYIQMSTPEAFRGRVLALYSAIFLGTTPVGSPFIGWVGEAFGARWSLLVGAIACIAIAVAGAAWAAHYWRLRVVWAGGRLEIVDAQGRTRAECAGQAHHIDSVAGSE